MTTTTRPSAREEGGAPPGLRERLLAGVPVEERRLDVAGIPTAVLEGGAGDPVVLLHGPGEFAAKWLRVLPELTRRHRVVAPDLPAHGDSGGAEDALGEERVLGWLHELIARTCPTPPALVGHVLGGAIAARFAARHPDALSRLVLVDALGLAPFRPAPRFALGLARMQLVPGERSYERFMRQCSYDLDLLREELGGLWDTYAAYTIELTRSPKAKAVRRMIRTLGLPPIPDGELAGIEVPTSLIWGRHDRANRLRVAEAASARHGWPLHVIEDCADDPARDRPDAFLRALALALGAHPVGEAGAAATSGAGDGTTPRREEP